MVNLAGALFPVSYLALILVVSFCLTILLAPLLAGPASVIASIFSDRSLRACLLSVATATISVAASLAVGIPSAYVLSKKRFPGRALLLELIRLPNVLPPVAIGLCLLLFFKRTGPGAFIDSLVGIVFEVPGIVVAQAAIVLPLVTCYLKDVFDTVDPRYVLMARSMGLSELEALVKVVIPMRWSGILGASTLAWVRAAGEFGATLMLAGATPYKTETLPISLYLAMARGDLAQAAVSVLFLAALGGLALVAMRLSGTVMRE